MIRGLIYRLSATATLTSQFVNVWVFGGNPDQTVSGRAWVEGELQDVVAWARGRRAIDAVFQPFEGPGHCARSHGKDVEFARYILGLPHSAAD